MYVAVKGGEAAILNSYRLLAQQRRIVSIDVSGYFAERGERRQACAFVRVE